MADTWRVHSNRGVANVPFDLAALYSAAWHRVNNSPRLSQHMDIIMSDGYASDEDHLRWVINGRVGEIEAWARRIADDRQ